MRDNGENKEWNMLNNFRNEYFYLMPFCFYGYFWFIKYWIIKILRYKIEVYICIRSDNSVYENWTAFDKGENNV
jgi:hypothetical protein